MIAHAGLTVPDLDRAVRWYELELGLHALGSVIEVVEGEGHGGIVAADVLGPGFGGFRQAHLSGANGVALELFEFDAPPPWAAGLFHLCLAVGDVDAVAARIRRRSRVWELFPGEPYRCCYCEDPFGNVVELYSHGHERVWANRS